MTAYMACYMNLIPCLVKTIIPQFLLGATVNGYNELHIIAHRHSSISPQYVLNISVGLLKLKVRKSRH